MVEELKVVVWFHEVGKGDIALAGGKGANLGEMTRFGTPVPPGFIVTADAYFHFIEESKLLERLQQSLQYLDPSDSRQLQETASQIKKAISTPLLANWSRQCYAELRLAKLQRNPGRPKPCTPHA